MALRFLGQLSQKLVKKVQYLVERRGPRVAHETNIGKTEWVDTGAWVNVISSWVKAIRYDKERKALIVMFNRGFIAQYKGISPEMAKNMFISRSMGKYVHQWLYKKINYTQVKA